MGALAAIHTVGAVGAFHIERAVASVVTLAVACMRTGVRARGGERSVEGRRRRDRAWRGRRTALLAEGETVGSGEGRQGEEDGHHRAERQEAVTQKREAQGAVLASDVNPRLSRKDFAYIIIPCEDDDGLSFMWQNSLSNRSARRHIPADPRAPRRDTTTDIDCMD